MAIDQDHFPENAYHELYRGRPESARSCAFQATAAPVDPVLEFRVHVVLALSNLARDSAAGARGEAEAALDVACTADLQDELAFLAISILCARSRDALPTCGSALDRLAWDRAVRLRAGADMALLMGFTRFTSALSEILLANGRPDEAAAACERVTALLLPLEIEAARARATWAAAQCVLSASSAPADIERARRQVAAAVAVFDEAGEADERFRCALLSADLHIESQSDIDTAERAALDAIQLAETTIDRVHVLARLGILATRHPSRRARFLDAVQSYDPAALPTAAGFADALEVSLVKIAQATLTCERPDLADAWVGSLGTCTDAVDPWLRSAAAAVRIEVMLVRGATAEALTAADGEFAQIERLVEVRRGIPELDAADITSRLTYVRTLARIEHADVRGALLAFDRGRRLNLRLSAHRDEPEHGAPQQPSYELDLDASRHDLPFGARPDPSRHRDLLVAGALECSKPSADGLGKELASEDAVPILPARTMVLAFLWDNRRGRLGVFVLEHDSADVAFHWLEPRFRGKPVAESLARTWELARSDFAELSARAIHAAVEKIIAAPFAAEPRANLARLVARRAPDRIVVIPHGPLVGLPLHVALRARRPVAAVSYAPLLTVPRRPALPAQDRRRFAVFGPEEPGLPEEEQRSFHDEIDACASNLAEAGLVRLPLGAAVAGPGRDALVRALAAGVLPRAGLVHVASHGKAVGQRRQVLRQHGNCYDGSEGDAGWAPSDASAVWLGKVGGRDRWLSTHEILAARRIDVDVVFLSICSGALPIHPLVTWPTSLSTASDRPAWQVRFLDDASMSLAGALLVAGVDQVLAYPFPVDESVARQFFTSLTRRYRDDCRAAPLVPGDYDWARATTAVVEGLQANLPGVDPCLAWHHQMIQHWSILQVLPAVPSVVQE